MFFKDATDCEESVERLGLRAINMEDNTTKHRVMPLVFVGLLLLSFTNGVHADEASDEFIIDGRLQLSLIHI